MASAVPKADQMNVGFTGCGENASGGRPGIYPRQKASKINEGFSP
jgi:hypothetical protein